MEGGKVALFPLAGRKVALFPLAGLPSGNASRQPLHMSVFDSVFSWQEAMPVACVAAPPPALSGQLFCALGLLQLQCRVQAAPVLQQGSRLRAGG